MHKSKSSVLVKKPPRNSISIIKDIPNQLNKEQNFKKNETKSPLAESSISTQKKSLGKISPSPRNSIMLSKSSLNQSNTRKNIYTNSYSKINKSKPNEENIIASKEIRINNSNNNNNLNDLEFTFKPPEIKNIANTTRHEKQNSIKFEGEINDNEVDKIIENSFKNNEEKGKN
jgi:hypothetical protein